MSERELPLFPLHVVLFPGMSLPLHVFEERYKAMMRVCLATDRTFGVVLIKEGREVGGPAVPFSVGTTALVELVESLPGERLNLLARGSQRFRLLEMLQREPYLVARVALLEEPRSQPEPAVLAEVIDLYREYLEATIPESERARLVLPEEPGELSFHIAAALRSQPLQQQALLELPTAAARLSRELALLRREVKFLRLLRSAPGAGASIGPFSLN